MNVFKILLDKHSNALSTRKLQLKQPDRRLEAERITIRGVHTSLANPGFRPLVELVWKKNGAATEAAVRLAVEVLLGRQ